MLEGDAGGFDITADEKISLRIKTLSFQKLIEENRSDIGWLKLIYVFAYRAYG